MGGSFHGQLLRAVFLNYFRKTDIAKNVVLRGELARFPYGASAVLRSSVVSLDFLEGQGRLFVIIEKDASKACLSKIF